jgi:MFS family permease
VDAPVAARPGDGRLFTLPFALLCLAAFLGYAQQMAIQPVLPLLVLERGGDAAVVGIVVGVFSIPSVVLRPLLGRLVDEWSGRGVFIVGLGTLGATGFLYLLPGMALLVATRLAHGFGWAAFNTAGYATLARIAPAARRGEASAVFGTMSPLAQLIMPASSLALLAAVGFGGSFALAGICATLGVLLVLVLPTTGWARPRAARVDVHSADEETPRGALLERGALLPMALEVLFSCTWPLFFALVPLHAVALGIGVEGLAIYYPVYGVVLVVSRFGLRGLSDRLGRRRLLLMGAATSFLALACAAVAQDLVLLTLGGALYALGSAVFSPTAMALAVDRAAPGRLGAAMATYTLGFQLAAGAGAAAWGFLIAGFGYPAPLLVALVVNALLIGVVLRTTRSARHATTPTG